MSSSGSSADLAFRAMGSDIRILVGPGPVDSGRAVAEARRWLEGSARRLSRFEPGSELCALNRSTAERVAVSGQLAAAVRAGIWAAEATGGLVDPTLLDEIEAIGYADSRDAVVPAWLPEALASAPARFPAHPHPAARWREVRVLEGAVERPPGVRLDTGGTGKGLLADAVVHRLAAHAWAVVDCGGDIRVAGGPFHVEVSHPLTGEVVHRLSLADCGVATSGLDVNVWRRPDGSYAHHLLDPATGEPAWTGLVGATALASTALEAETLAKQALLSGPAGARKVLAGGGGVLFHEDGDVEVIDPLANDARAVLVAGGAAG